MAKKLAAVGLIPNPAANPVASAEPVGRKAAQNAAHSVRIGREGEAYSQGNQRKNPGNSGVRESCVFEARHELAEEERELCHQNPENYAFYGDGGAECGALFQDARISRDLRVVVDAWPTLPTAIKTGILALVRAAE